MPRGDPTEVGFVWFCRVLSCIRRIRVNNGEHPTTDKGAAMHMPTEKIAFTIAEAVTSTGIGRTKLYDLIKQGQLETRKLGSRTLIPAPSLRSLVDGLPRSAKSAA